METPSPVALYRHRRVAVLGASGFLGRWTARALGRCGACVYLFVRRRAAAERVLGALGVYGNLIELDLGDGDALVRAFEEIRPSITFNLAGYGVKHSEQDESAAWRLNVELVTNVCRAAAAALDRSWLTQHVVHAGSALEYGPSGSDLAEDSISEPATVYGKTKLAGTLRLIDAQHRYGIRGLVARLFTVYGSGEHPGRLLPSLLAGAREARPIPLSFGTQKRDFVYVEDVAEALLRLGVASVAAGEIVNVATGRLTSVRGFVEAAASELGIPPEHLKFGALQPRFQEGEHGDVTIRKLRRLARWSPQTGIVEGIRKTVEYEQRQPPVQPAVQGR